MNSKNSSIILAVITLGVAPTAALSASGADEVLEDLSDTAAFLRALV